MKQIFKRISPAEAAFFLKYGYLPMSGGAVENKYVDSAIVAGKLGSALTLCSGALYAGVATFETAAADDDESVYRVFKNVDSNLIPLSLRLACDAITGMTDLDCGLYDNLEAGGAVVDIDCLADGINPSAGYSRILALDLLVSVDLAEVKKRLWELVDAATLTLETKKPSYDIALTGRTNGSGVGTMSVIGLFTQG